MRLVPALVFFIIILGGLNLLKNPLFTQTPNTQVIPIVIDNMSYNQMALQADATHWDEIPQADPVPLDNLPSTPMTPQVEASLWVGVRFAGRLGNQMFQTASCYGIAAARKTRCCLYDYEGSMLSEAVEMLVPVEKCPETPVITQSEGRFNQDFVSSLMDPVESNTTVGVYLQSWMYLPASLPFALLHRTWAAGWVKKRGINVGIHIRLGDMGQNFPVSFFHKAIAHLQKLDPLTQFVFVVVSDDTVWVKAQLVFNNMTVSEGHLPGQDMSILAACKHVIITVGTFAWWSAYLKSEPGYVLHYTPHLKILSPGGTNLTAYYPPDWIGFMYEPQDPCHLCPVSS